MSHRKPLFPHLLLAILLAACGHAHSAPAVSVRLIAFNDFHGYIDAPGPVSLPQGLGSVKVPLGGAANLAAKVAALRAGHPLSMVVGAGDMVGASPLDSALFHDEPTIQALGRIGLEYTSVGNHEFDRGAAELLRKQRGGCYPGGKTGADTCMVDGRFAGAQYQYLAANVIDTATGKTLFPSYAIKRFDLGSGKSLAIAFIGLVLRQTPQMVNGQGVAGLRFTDEAEAANAMLPELRKQGVNAVVVLIHQGVITSVGYDDHSCGGVSGGLLPILDRLDPSIPLVVSGHTHWPYICQGQGTSNRQAVYTSAGKYGEFLTAIDLGFDTQGRLLAIEAHNQPVVDAGAPNPDPRDYPALPPDQEVAALVGRYDSASAPLVNRPVAAIAADFTTAGEDLAAGGSGESALGDLIADAQLEAARQADPHPPVAAFMNAGGIRNSLLRGAGGQVSYGQAFNVQPFGDTLVDLDLSGAELEQLLAQQFSGHKAHVLEVSEGLSYAWNGEGLVAGSIRINGKPLDPAASYRIEVNNFLASGGDGFSVLKQGHNQYTGPSDIDALCAYLTAHAPARPAVGGRIKRLN